MADAPALKRITTRTISVSASGNDPAHGATVAAQARDPNSGLIVMPESFTSTHRSEITSLAIRYRLPAVYAYAFSLNLAACCLTVPTSLIIGGGRLSMLIVF